MKENILHTNFMAFLNTRQQVIRLRPTAAPVAGYVWKKVFLRGGHPKDR